MGGSPRRVPMRYSVRTFHRANCTEARTMTKDPAAAEEVTRLRDCIDDYVGIMELPARWTAAEPS